MELDFSTTQFLRAVSSAGAWQPGRDAPPQHELDEFMTSWNGPGPNMSAVVQVSEEDPSIRAYVPLVESLGTVVHFEASWSSHRMAHVEPVLKKLAERTSCTFVSVPTTSLWPGGGVSEATDVVDRAMRAVDTARHTWSAIDAPVFVSGEGIGAALALVAGALVPGRLAGQVLVAPSLGGPPGKGGGISDLFVPAGVPEEWWSRAGRSATESVAAAALPTLILIPGLDPFQAGAHALGRSLTSERSDTQVVTFDNQGHGWLGVLNLHVGELGFQQIISFVRPVALARAEARRQGAFLDAAPIAAPSVARR